MIQETETKCPFQGECNYLIVRLVDPVKETKGGILMPDMTKKVEQLYIGAVVNHGPDCIGHIVPGKTLRFLKHMGCELHTAVENELEFVAVREVDVICSDIPVESGE